MAPAHRRDERQATRKGASDSGGQPVSKRRRGSARKLRASTGIRGRSVGTQRGVWQLVAAAGKASAPPAEEEGMNTAGNAEGIHPGRCINRRSVVAHDKRWRSTLMGWFTRRRPATAYVTRTREGSVACGIATSRHTYSHSSSAAKFQEGAAATRVRATNREINRRYNMSEQIQNAE